MITAIMPMIASRVTSITMIPGACGEAVRRGRKDAVQGKLARFREKVVGKTRVFALGIYIYVRFPQSHLSTQQLGCRGGGNMYKLQNISRSGQLQSGDPARDMVGLKTVVKPNHGGKHPKPHRSDVGSNCGVVQ